MGVLKGGGGKKEPKEIDNYSIEDGQAHFQLLS